MAEIGATEQVIPSHVKKVVQPIPALPFPEKETEALTPREQDVLTFMAQGLSNSEIAKQLSYARQTVEGHINTIYLRVTSGNPEKDRRSEAVLRHISAHPEFQNPLEGHELSKPFNQREKEALILVGQGLSNKAISQRLIIEEKTVERHIWNILSKLKIDRVKQNPRIMMVLAAQIPQFFPTPPEREMGTFTPRENDVLALMAQGLSNASIEQQLPMKHKTVEHHINNIFSKLGTNRGNDEEKNPRVKAVLKYISEHPKFHNPLEGYEPSKPFTQLERGVLTLIGQGLSNQEISRRLFVEKSTVEGFIWNILSKLKIDRVKQNPRIMMVLAAKAIQEKAEK